MDVLNLDEAIPKAQKVGDELIDRAERAAQVVLDSAVKQLRDNVGEVLLMHFAARVEEIIAQLDGWRLTVGPITIPAFDIRLARPK